MKKRSFICLIFLICLSFLLTSNSYLFADLGDPFNTDNIASDGQLDPIFKSQFDKVWNTAIYIARVAAFIGIFILGITYIFANADKKADLKKGLVPVLIGIVIFFGSTYIIDFVVKIFNDI